MNVGGDLLFLATIIASNQGFVALTILANFAWNAGFTDWADFRGKKNSLSLLFNQFYWHNGTPVLSFPPLRGKFMSRVIHIENPTQVRTQHRRLIAELLRRLIQKPQVDGEAKDMAAKIVYSLREIVESVDQSAKAWEKRGYWMKAERFLREWTWTAEAAANIEDVLRHEAWDLLPELLADLFPRFADIQLKSLKQPTDLWQGAYKKLLADPPSPLPW